MSIASLGRTCVVGHHEWMTRSESFLLKVQGGELDVDRQSWSEAAIADGDRGVGGGRCLDGSGRLDGRCRLDGCRRNGYRPSSMADVCQRPASIRSAKP